jgi:hypothetical protein
MPTIAAFLNGVAILIMFFRSLCLSGDRQLSVVKVDLYVLFRNTRELERRSDEIVLSVFVEIHSSDHLSALGNLMDRAWPQDLPWLIRLHSTFRAADALRLMTMLVAFRWEENVGEAFEVVKGLVEEDGHLWV